MALEAPDRFVTTLQLPSRQIVVELVEITAWPAHQLRGSTEVFDVAVLAGLALVLTTVQAGAGRDLCAEIFVAAKAQGRDDLLARLMALTAIVVAIEAGVRRRQRAWR